MSNNSLFWRGCPVHCSMPVALLITDPQKCTPKGGGVGGTNPENQCFKTIIQQSCLYIHTYSKIVSRNTKPFEGVESENCLCEDHFWYFQYETYTKSFYHTHMRTCTNNEFLQIQGLTGKEHRGFWCRHNSLVSSRERTTCTNRQVDRQVSMQGLTLCQKKNLRIPNAPASVWSSCWAPW